MITAETELRVLYAHTDVMGVMNNVRYLEYFEAGRNTLMREMGYPYVILEGNNIGLPVIEAHVNYRSTALYDDVIIIRAMLKSVPTARVTIDYELYIGDRLIATGYTTHAFLKLDSMKPTRPPKDFVELIKIKI